MQVDFSRTLRALHADAEHSRWRYVTLTVSMVLLAGWLAWLLLARVPVYEVSQSARLEVARMGSPVEAVVAGRVVYSSLALGRDVVQGEPLIELDARVIREKLTGVDAKLQALQAQRTARLQEMTAEQRLLTEQRERSQAAIESAEARVQQLTAAATFASESAAQKTKLFEQQFISDFDVRQAQSEAAQRQAEASAAQLETQRLRWQKQLEGSEASTRLKRVESSLAELEGDIASLKAESQSLQRELDNHIIRAPATGRLGEVSTKQAGSVVQAGERLATIVPLGELRAVAEFAPSSAIGRLQVGQDAKMRLDGFPWTQYGTLKAQVKSVGNEVRDGKVRVELALVDANNTMLPTQHGLPGVADVEVERVSPWALILRQAAKILRQPAADVAPAVAERS